MKEKKAWAAVSPGECAPVGLRENPLEDDGSPASQNDEDSFENVAAEADDLEVSDPEAVILCRRCGHQICRPADRTVVSGSFRHTFANPAGMVFEIGCYRTAPGCGPSGTYTGEFTWFRGYQWRLALCRACFVHLGWQFSADSGENGFWALIFNRLSFPV